MANASSSEIQLILLLSGLACIALSPAFLFEKETVGMGQFAVMGLLVLGMILVILAAAVGE